MIKLQILILLLIFLICCTTPYSSVIKKYDEFENTTNYSTACNVKVSSFATGVLEIFVTNAPTIVDFVLGKLITAENDTLFYINVLLSSHDWLFIEEGESLILLIDGESIKLYGTGSSNYREVGKSINSASISEESRYLITPDLIKKIAYASNVRVKIIGKNRSIIGELTEQCFANFKRFVNEVIETQ